MVIVNPKLSLPTDLPYKKRQRPFFSNTPLQQATIRYNEAIRKKYNDIQFAKRLENGSATQNEVMGVNTIDISKMVDPSLFAEMSNMPPVSLVKKRRSKRFDRSPHEHSTTGDIIGTSSRSSRHASACVENIRQSNTNTSSSTIDESLSVHNSNTSNTTNYDCNSTEMFPHLQPSGNMEAEKTSTPAYFPVNMKPPPSTSSLETQAINEYEPTIDSAHDMIFGNVMGMDYGNYIHGPLWTPQQGCGNNNEPEQPQHFHTAPPSLCCSSKLSGVGYLQPPQMPMHSVPPPPPQLMFDLGCCNAMNENGNNTTVLTPLTVMGRHGGQVGSGRRSTSVPRPRTGLQKETLKQAAIRCGIIKGNHTVAAIPKRSHCLAPLQLAPVQSDPVVSVIEILHPKTIPACSSEALVDFQEFMFKNNIANSNESSDVYVIHNNKSTPALNIAMNVPGDSTKLDNSRIVTEKSNSEGHSPALSENVPESVLRTLENAASCPIL